MDRFRLSSAGSSLRSIDSRSTESLIASGATHSPLAAVARRMLPFHRRFSTAPSPAIVTPSKFEDVVLKLQHFFRSSHVALRSFPKLSMQSIGACRWKGICYDNKTRTFVHSLLTLDPDTEVFTLQVSGAQHALDLRFRANSQFYHFKRKLDNPDAVTLKPRLSSLSMVKLVTREPWRFATVVATESYGGGDEGAPTTESMTFKLDAASVSQACDDWEHAVWEEEHGLQITPTMIIPSPFEFTPGLYVHNSNCQEVYFDQADISLDIDGHEVLVLRKFHANNYPKYSPMEMLRSYVKAQRVVVYY